jgi:hypothetical protein
MWEPRHLTTLWATSACYRDSFIFSPYFWESCRKRKGPFWCKSRLSLKELSRCNILHGKAGYISDLQLTGRSSTWRPFVSATESDSSKETWQYAPPVDDFMQLCVISFHFYWFDCEVQETIDVIDFYAARNPSCSRPRNSVQMTKKKGLTSNRSETQCHVRSIYLCYLMMLPVVHTMQHRMAIIVNSALGRM